MKKFPNSLSAVIFACMLVSLYVSCSDDDIITNNSSSSYSSVSSSASSQQPINGYGFKIRNESNAVFNPMYFSPGTADSRIGTKLLGKLAETDTYIVDYPQISIVCDVNGYLFTLQTYQTASSRYLPTIWNLVYGQISTITIYSGHVAYSWTDSQHYTLN